MPMFFRILGVLALISAALGVLELVATWDARATVFQQIAARVSVGLSTLVFIVAFGFASLLEALPGKAEVVGAKRSFPVAKHAGTDIYKDGETFFAVYNGERISGDSVNKVRVGLAEAQSRSA